jgi:hypothetical protein
MIAAVIRPGAIGRPYSVLKTVPATPMAETHGPAHVIEAELGGLVWREDGRMLVAQLKLPAPRSDGAVP